MNRAIEINKLVVVFSTSITTHFIPLKGGHVSALCTARDGIHEGARGVGVGGWGDRDESDNELQLFFFAQTQICGVLFVFKH